MTSTSSRIPPESQQHEDTQDLDHVSARQKTIFCQMFEKLETKDGYLSGGRAAALLRKTGLPQETLAKIWALSDHDQDGRLSMTVCS